MSMIVPLGSLCPYLSVQPMEAARSRIILTPYLPLATSSSSRYPAPSSSTTQRNSAYLPYSRVMSARM